MKTRLVWLCCGSLILVLATNTSATARSRAASLIIAKLEKVEDLPSAPGNQIEVDGKFRLIFQPKRALIGPLPKAPIAEDWALAKPVPGYDYYLLVERSAGSSRVVWSGFVGKGICIDRRTIEGYDMAKPLQQLQKSNPCRSN